VSLSRFAARLACALPVVLLAALGPVAPARAAGVLHSEVDAKRVGVQDQVQLTVTVEGSNLPGDAPVPTLRNLRIVGGPAVSTQMSWVNGQASQSRSWTFDLMPIAPGPAEVGTIAMRIGGSDVVAQAIQIEVVPGSIQPPPAQRRSTDPFDRDPFEDFFGRRRAAAAEPKLFVEARVNRNSLFVGEPLLLTYYLYTQASISGLQLSNAPQYSGFWAEDLEQPSQPTGEQATVDGVPYTRFPVLTKLLYPTRAGRLTIPEATLSIGVARTSIFDQGGVVQRSTKPIAVEVKAIPDEAGFSGAVGKFTASASLDRPVLNFGEAATLRFRVEGSGNLKWIDRGPELVVPGAKVYPPQVKSDLQSKPTGISGSRTWEYVVVPQTAGTLQIPALTFSHFDPVSGRMMKSETAPLPLRVEAGTASSAPMPPVPGPSSPSRGGQLPLRADLELRPAGFAIPGAIVGWAALSALMLHGVLLGGDRLLRRAPAGGGGTGRAPRGTRDALGDLRRVHRDKLSKEQAAARIEKVIHGVFGSLEGDDSDRARAVRTLLEEVHAVRYAPQLGDYSEKVRDLAARAGEVVRRWA
jgi:hypothetical protein